MEKEGKIVDFMVTKYCLEQLGHDFLGYRLQKEDDRYTFHHLIIPACCGGETTEDNGAILCMKSGHPYIHIVGRYDSKLFKELTAEIIEMKEKGVIDQAYLATIDQMLTYFESRFDGKYNKKNHLIIRPEFKIRVQRSNY